jgi:RecB family endonuclease NucS
MCRRARCSPARIFAAQEIKPQARTLAKDRGIECVVVVAARDVVATPNARTRC